MKEHLGQWNHTGGNCRPFGAEDTYSQADVFGAALGLRVQTVHDGGPR